MSELDKILKKAESERDKLNHPYVGTEHLLLSLLSYDNELTTYLKDYNLTYNKFKKKIKEVIGMGSSKSPYILYTPMLRKVLSIIDEEKTSNIHLDLFNALIKTNEGIAIRILESMNIKFDSSITLNDNYMVIDEGIKITEREKEISEIFQILMRKNKCNPLLLGEAGVGKTAIVEEIQRRLKNKDCPTCLIGYQIKVIDISSLVAGTKYRGDFESKVEVLINNVKNKKIILFIDEIHTLVNAGGAEGAISLGDIIKPYLARSEIKCIGATTLREYHKYFEIDDALNRRFQKIIIMEPSIESTKNILNNIKKIYEEFHNLKINDDLIDNILIISNKYITTKRNPDKAIELLDSCCSNAKYFEQHVVTSNNLYNIFECTYGLNLNNKIILNILNNKQIISDISIIEKFTYNANKIIIDGNEFKSEDDIFKLLGNPHIKNSNYILKSVIDIPVGVLQIINYNYNEILKESIFKIINTRNLVDNYGNEICLNNYIIVMNQVNNNIIGFNKESYIIQNNKLPINA